MKRLIVILVLPLSLVATDFAARYWLLVNVPPSVGAYRFSRPAAYARSAYWSLDYAYEQADFAHSWTLDEDALWVSDFASAHFNHSGYVRRTVGQPSSAPTLYLIGSSTVLNEEVPDEFTIASYLQVLVGPEFRVVNLGTIGARTDIQLRLLKTLTLYPGDMVVFYDGVTNSVEGAAGRGTYCPDGFLLGLATVQVVCELADRTRAMPEQRPDLDAARTTFAGPLVEAQRYATAHGAAFYHFLEPNIWSEPPQTDTERALLANYHIIPPEFTAFHALTWPTLQAVTRHLPGADLTHCLDAIRRGGVDVFLDYDHVTENGNRAIARAIWDALTVF